MSFVSPIPIKPSSAPAIFDKPLHLNPNLLPLRKVPSLDVLVDICYRSKKMIDSLDSVSHLTHLIWPVEKLLAYQFTNYCTAVHCQELLNFLIQIFSYEHLYDSLFPENENLRLNTPSPKLGETPNQNIIPSSMGSISRKPGYTSSIRSVELKESLTSCTNALPGDSLTNIWDELMEKELANDLDEDLIVDIDEEDSSVRTGLHNAFAKQSGKKSNHDNVGTADEILEKETKLLSLWRQILKRYIVEDAPDQINLSNDAYREIVAQDAALESNEIPSPNSLWKAKNEVLQLMKENVYSRFSSAASKNDPKDRCKVLGLPCSSLKQDIDYVELPLHSSRTSPLAIEINTGVKVVRGENSGTPRTLIDIDGAELTPEQSASRKKRILRNFTSPGSAPSGSSSPSSISALIGHLKISNPNSSGESRSNSPSGGNDSEENTKRRFWRHKK